METFLYDQLFTTFVVPSKFPSLIDFAVIAYTALMEEGRFPNKLKKYRRCAGYSQKKLARLLGLSDTSLISRWEHGLVLPGTVQLFRLSRIFGTHPHLLFDLLWNRIVSEQDLFAPDEHITSNEALYT